jgi:hypothetical protein
MSGSFKYDGSIFKNFKFIFDKQSFVIGRIFLNRAERSISEEVKVITNDRDINSKSNNLTTKVYS